VIRVAAGCVVDVAGRGQTVVGRARVHGHGGFGGRGRRGRARRPAAAVYLQASCAVLSGLRAGLANALLGEVPGVCSASSSPTHVLLVGVT
jgi:hypothetical protein